MRKKKFRKVHQIKKKGSIFKNRFFWLGILFFVFISSFCYFLFFSEIFQIKKIIITGTEKVSKEEIMVVTEKQLENKILFFNTKNIFLISLDKIRKDILNSFPQIATAEIGRGFPDALDILVTERSGLAVWCKDEECFLLDIEGIIFEKTTPETNLIKIIDKEKIAPVNLRERVVGKDFLSKIVEIEKRLKTDLQVQIQEFLIISQERLNIKTSEGWEVFLNPQGDVEWQLTKLKAVLEEEIPLEKRRDLEYIELRFGNLAPVKYKD